MGKVILTKNENRYEILIRSRWGFSSHLEAIEQEGIVDGHYPIYHEKIYFTPRRTIDRSLVGLVHEKQEIPEKLLKTAKSVAVQIAHSKGYELINNLDKANLSEQKINLPVHPAP